MFTEQIIISKNEILTKYRNLDKKVKNIIQILYTIAEYDKEYQVENFDIRIKKVKIENIINENSNNFLQELYFVNLRTGVYIFLDEYNIPIYIGFGGRGESNSLKTRISDQLRGNETSTTLVKNIRELEKYLNPNISLSNDVKKLLLKYTSSLIVIDCGTQIEKNVRFAQSLEVILIALFNSKYNK
jgi:hypothetical protein